MKVARGPTSGEQVGSWRVTEGIYEDGREFVVQDCWKTATDPHVHLAQLWTGTTTFYHKKAHF